MILMIGHLTDPTTVHTIRAAKQRGCQFDFLELRSFLERGEFFWDSRTKSGFIELDDKRWTFPSHTLTGIYCRLIDVSDRFRGKLKRRMRSRVIGLTKILNETSTFVVNRPGFDISNAAKVYHTELLRQVGFATPEYILTNNPVDARSFLNAYPDAIYKGASSAKTIATLVNENDLSRLSQVSHTPVLFQRRIVGDEIRAHIVGEETFAERIITEAVDYRFDSEDKHMVSTELPADILNKVQQYRVRSGLTLIGIDFRVTANGDFYILEANPMPGYDGYDRRAKLAISNHLLTLLDRGSVTEPASVQRGA